MLYASLLDRRSVQISLLGVLIAAIYWKSLFNGFAYDDWYFIVGVPAYRNIDIAIIFSSMANGIEYLPLRDLSLCVDYLFWGEKNPGGFHLSNIVWFYSATIALYFLVSELIILTSRDGTPAGVKRFVPLLAAALFAAHPVNGEAVNFIGARNVLLSSLFFFMAAFYYSRNLRGGRVSYGKYLAALGFFLCALLSKATVIILPFLLLAMHLTACVKVEYRRIHWLYPFFALTAVFYYLFTKVGVAARLIEKTPFQADAGSAWISAKIATAAEIPFFYIWKLLVPTGLTARYEVAFDKTVFSPLPMAAVAGILIFLAAAWLFRRDYPLVSLAVFWFLVTLIPVLNLYDTHPVVADRYLFIPGAALFLLAALALAKLFETSIRGSPR